MVSCCGCCSHPGHTVLEWEEEKHSWFHAVVVVLILDILCWSGRRRNILGFMLWLLFSYWTYCVGVGGGETFLVSCCGCCSHTGHTVLEWEEEKHSWFHAVVVFLILDILCWSGRRRNILGFMLWLLFSYWTYCVGVGGGETFLVSCCGCCSHTGHTVLEWEEEKHSWFHAVVVVLILDILCWSGRRRNILGFMLWLLFSYWTYCVGVGGGETFLVSCCGCCSHTGHTVLEWEEEKHSWFLLWLLFSSWTYCVGVGGGETFLVSCCGCCSHPGHTVLEWEEENMRNKMDKENGDEEGYEERRRRTGSRLRTRRRTTRVRRGRRRRSEEKDEKQLGH